MKKWLGGVLMVYLITMLVMRDGVTKNPFGKNTLPSSIIVNASDPINLIQAGTPPAVHSPDTDNQVIPDNKLLSNLFTVRNLSDEMENSLLTWNHMKHLANYSHSLPNGVEAIREAQVAWDNLMHYTNEGSLNKLKENQCPYFLNKMDVSGIGAGNGYKLQIPCGLIQGSAITIIGIPTGNLGSFQIDLAGEQLPGELEPPVVLHYSVRLLGDSSSVEPVIVQNTWTAAHGWDSEERCPAPVYGNYRKVDELMPCNTMVGKDVTHKSRVSKLSRISMRSSDHQNRTKFFPFKKGYLSIMTLRVGEEGIQMTVDGKQITSFAYRENLEPWLVGEIRISGDLQLISVMASGLPSYEESEHVADINALKSAQLPPHEPLDLFIGVFSTANNFKRRMAVRRTWMQYPEVKSGAVAVRFFVGLHYNQLVNEELLKELQTFGDIQLMPFADYYSLITWKTIGICIFGAEVLSAKYVMKTDDDAFVRVDEVLTSLKKSNVRRGLLYGLINSNSQPHRSTESKWYISSEEWPENVYPPWAHGPGYVVSRDIAKTIYRRHKKGYLKMFKLEDVAMGIWIAEMKKVGLQVNYINEERIYNQGCKDGYIVAHYQSSTELLCLWQRLQEQNKPLCCSSQ